MDINNDGVIVFDDGIPLYFETFADVYDTFGDSVVWDYVEEAYIVMYEEDPQCVSFAEDEGYYSDPQNSEDLHLEEGLPEGW